ncbi:hypothetical protein OUZ56_010409 [Daphnia magna]|uniref:Uncharacterized protein n=1 Tax=Daphnia magna TaxID=35525 RepID=A0ABR0AIH0_9CRUS|nr:hypothetical protein OUZ56_010409 [Daphnia magna]
MPHILLCGTGSSERSLLEDALKHRQATCEEIPFVIADKEYWTDDVHYQTMELLQKSISASLEARKSWKKDIARTTIREFYQQQLKFPQEVIMFSLSVVLPPCCFMFSDSKI